MTGTKSKEIWVPVSGLEDLLEVSNHGRVRSFTRAIETKRHGVPVRYELPGRLRKLHKTRGYEQVLVWPPKNHPKRTGRSLHIYVHRLVATAFLPADASRTFVNHKNGVRHDNRVENLEWCTVSENILDRYRRNPMTPVGNRKFSDEQIAKVRSLRSEGKTCKVIGGVMGMPEITVYFIVSGRRRI